jgi:hypothetical protein
MNPENSEENYYPPGYIAPTPKSIKYFEAYIIDQQLLDKVYGTEAPFDQFLSNN